jgi:hypothetical protein
LGDPESISEPNRVESFDSSVDGHGQFWAACQLHVSYACHLLGLGLDRYAGRRRNMRDSGQPSGK